MMIEIRLGKFFIYYNQKSQCRWVKTATKRKSKKGWRQIHIIQCCK